MMFLTMSSVWSNIIPDSFFQWWNCCLVSCCSSCTCVADFSCLGTKLALILIELHSTSFKGYFSRWQFHFDLSSCLPNKLLVVLVAFYSILLTFWYRCCHQSTSTFQDLTEQLDYTFVACFPKLSQKVIVFQPGNQPSQGSKWLLVQDILTHQSMA